MPTKILLASQSPFRKALLEQVGLSFEMKSANVDERLLEKSFNGPIEELSTYLSQKKAESLVTDFPEHLIIGSDQVLIFENKPLHKPTTFDEVVQRLKTLQGKTHRLSTGLCLLYEDKTYLSQVSADLKMHSLDDEEIINYAKTDQPLGCAGGYKIEKQGPLLFESIQTLDHHSIIGLPLLSLTSQLRKLGILRP